MTSLVLFSLFSPPMANKVFLFLFFDEKQFYSMDYGRGRVVLFIADDSVLSNICSAVRSFCSFCSSLSLSIFVCIFSKHAIQHLFHLLFLFLRFPNSYSASILSSFLPTFYLAFAFPLLFLPLNLCRSVIFRVKRISHTV